MKQINYRILFKFLSIYFILIFLSSCATKQFNLPVKEIDRPISLPNGYWRLGYGTGNQSYKNFKNKTISEFHFDYPFFELSNNLEYHFPFKFKYQLLRNDVDKDNNLQNIDGNSLITFGIHSLGRADTDDYLYTLGLTMDYKKPFNRSSWYKINSTFLFTKGNKNDSLRRSSNTSNIAYYLTHLISIGYGYQFFEHLYSTIDLGLTNKNFHDNFDDNDHDDSNNYRILRINFDDYRTSNKLQQNYVIIPIKFAYNINSTFTIYSEFIKIFNNDNYSKLYSFYGFHATF